MAKKQDKPAKAVETVKVLCKASVKFLGKTHKPETVIEVPADVADELVDGGFAERVFDEPAAPVQSSGLVAGGQLAGNPGQQAGDVAGGEQGDGQPGNDEQGNEQPGGDGKSPETPNA